MKAAQLYQPGEWRYIDIPEPQAPGRDEALVRVHAVGICGTDYSGYLGKMPFFSYPRIPGHELGVEVLAVGEAVESVQPGERCAVEPYINCQSCYACRRGFTNCCERHQTLGVHCDGGLRPLLLVPARKLHPAAGLSNAQCALVETLAIGCHAVDRAGAKAGESLLVVGAGPIGLSVIEFARLAGTHTIVADTNTSRLDFVRNHMEIRDTLQSKLDASDFEAIRQFTGGRGCDIVIDATGSHTSMARSLEYCAFAGRLVYVGITQEPLVIPHAAVMHRRELTLLASRNALTRDFRRIIDWIRKGQIDTSNWISHRADFDKFIAQFPQWLKPESNVIKAIVEIPS